MREGDRAKGVDASCDALLSKPVDKMEHRESDESIRVLILADMPKDAELVEKELREGRIDFPLSRPDLTTRAESKHG